MIKSHAKQASAAPVVIGWVVTITVILFYAYEFFLRNAPSPMHDYFQAIYSTTPSQLGRIDAAYYWTYIPMQIIVGTLMDHYGVRKPLFLAIFSCVFGSVLFGIENSYNLVLLGRMLIGFGSAFGFVAVLKTATLWLPKRYFPLAVGIATSLGMMGAVSSLIAITAIMQVFGADTTIDLFVLSGLGLMIITYFIVYDKQQPARKSHAGRRLQMIKQTITSVFGNPQVWLAGFIGLSLYLPTQVVGLWGIPYFNHIHGFPKVASASIASLIFWGWVIGSPLVGLLAEYVKNRRLIIITGSAFTLSIIYLLFFLPLTDKAEIMIAIFLLGFFSSTQILAFDIAASACKRSHAGTAVAVTNMIVMLGGPLQEFIGYIIESATNTANEYTLSGFQDAFFIMPVMIILACLVTLLIRDNTQYD